MQSDAHSYDPAPLNEAMRRQGFTNEKLAVRADLAARTISSIRNGDENVRLATLKKAAGALNLKLIIQFVPEGEASSVKT